MQQLEQLSARIFSSDPAIGKIGSIDLNIWLAQVSGVPVMGLKNETPRIKSILTIYGVIMTVFITAAYLGFEMYDLLLFGMDLDALTQNVCLSLTHISGALKIINVFFRLSDVREVIHKLKFVTQKYVRSEQQHRAFFRGEFENKIPLTIYGSMVAFTGLFGMAVLFYSPEKVAGKIFPYRAKLPAWLPYQIQLAYMGISVLFYAVQIVAIDYLNVTLMNQIRFQLNILNLSFDELVTSDHRLLAKAEHAPVKDAYQQLRSIVQHHCMLIKLRDTVEHIFRIPTLIQFFTSLVIFAVTGFQATVRSGGSNGAFLIYFYCGCIFCELFVYCWFGNDVFEQSKTLTTTAYRSPWYQQDKRFQKSLMIFLINTQRPFFFTAGGFMGLSLPSFSVILSRSYSFLAVLRQMYGR